MTISLEKKDYDIDRKGASKLLKVSIRTVDRYVKSEKLSTINDNGRVLLSKKEISAFKRNKNRQNKTDNVNMSTSEVSIDNEEDKVDNNESTKQANVDILSTSTSTKKRPGKVDKAIYKKLYEGLKSELNEKQARLEIANYRVGQLEAQIKNSVPMLEYHQERYQKEKEKNELEEKISLQNKLISRLNSRVKTESINKRIFLIILLIILALQPLWIIFKYY